LHGQSRAQGRKHRDVFREAELDVEIECRERRALDDGGNAANQDEPNAVTAKRSEKGRKVTWWGGHGAAP